MFPWVMYTLYNSVPINGLKTKLQKVPLMLGKALWKQWSFGWDSQNQTKEDNKSYQQLKFVINDPLIPVKFRFFVKTALVLNKFLVLYQTKKPMVPFITQSLEEIVRSFASTFMLAEKLEAAETWLSLSKISYKDPSCHKRATGANPSISNKTELSDLKTSWKINGTQFLKFMFDMVSILSALRVHFVEKSPVKYSLTRNNDASSPTYLWKHLKPASKNSVTY